MKQKMEIIRLSSGLLLAAVFLCASPVHAASKKDPNKDALRRLQMQIKQAQDEKAALAQEKDALANEMEALKKKTGGIEAAVARANRARSQAEEQAESLKREHAALTEKTADLERRLAENEHSLRDTRQNLQQETSQKQRLEQTLGSREKELGVCENKNKKLYQYQVELINRAQNRGTLAALLEMEPLTQMKRVELENLLEEYRDKIDSELIVKRAR